MAAGLQVPLVVPATAGWGLASKLLVRPGPSSTCAHRATATDGESSIIKIFGMHTRADHLDVCYVGSDETTWPYHHPMQTGQHAPPRTDGPTPVASGWPHGAVELRQ